MKNTTRTYYQRKIDTELQNIDRKISDAHKAIELLQALKTRTKKDGGQFVNFSQNFENEFVRNIKIEPRYNHKGAFIGYHLVFATYMTNWYVSVDLYVDCRENDVQAVLQERDKKIDYYKRYIAELNYQKDNLQRIFDETIAPFVDAIENEEENGYRYLSTIIRNLL